MEKTDKSGDGSIEPADALGELSFDNLPPAMRMACENAGWNNLTPVQAKAIPCILAGRDMMISRALAAAKPALTSCPSCRK